MATLSTTDKTPICACFLNDVPDVPVFGIIVASLGFRGLYRLRLVSRALQYRIDITSPSPSSSGESVARRRRGNDSMGWAATAVLSTWGADGSGGRYRYAAFAGGARGCFGALARWSRLEGFYSLLDAYPFGLLVRCSIEGGGRFFVGRILAPSGTADEWSEIYTYSDAPPLRFFISTAEAASHRRSFLLFHVDITQPTGPAVFSPGHALAMRILESSLPSRSCRTAARGRPPSPPPPKDGGGGGSDEEGERKEKARSFQLGRVIPRPAIFAEKRLYEGIWDADTAGPFAEVPPASPARAWPPALDTERSLDPALAAAAWFQPDRTWPLCRPGDCCNDVAQEQEAQKGDEEREGGAAEGEEEERRGRAPSHWRSWRRKEEEGRNVCSPPPRNDEAAARGVECPLREDANGAVSIAMLLTMLPMQGSRSVSMLQSMIRGGSGGGSGGCWCGGPYGSVHNPSSCGCSHDLKAMLSELASWQSPHTQTSSSFSSSSSSSHSTSEGATFWAGSTTTLTLLKCRPLPSLSNGWVDGWKRQSNAAVTPSGIYEVTIPEVASILPTAEHAADARRAGSSSSSSKNDEDEDEDGSATFHDCIGTKFQHQLVVCSQHVLRWSVPPTPLALPQHAEDDDDGGDDDDDDDDDDDCGRRQNESRFVDAVVLAIFGSGVLGLTATRLPPRILPCASGGGMGIGGGGGGGGGAAVQHVSAAVDDTALRTMLAAAVKEEMRACRPHRRRNGQARGLETERRGESESGAEPLRNNGSMASRQARCEGGSKASLRLLVWRKLTGDMLVPAGDTCAVAVALPISASGSSSSSLVLEEPTRGEEEEELTAAAGGGGTGEVSRNQHRPHGNNKNRAMPSTVRGSSTLGPGGRPMACCVRLVPDAPQRSCSLDDRERCSWMSGSMVTQATEPPFSPPLRPAPIRGGRPGNRQGNRQGDQRGGVAQALPERGGTRADAGFTFVGGRTASGSSVSIRFRRSAHDYCPLPEAEDRNISKLFGGSCGGGGEWSLTPWRGGTAPTISSSFRFGGYGGLNGGKKKEVLIDV